MTLTRREADRDMLLIDSSLFHRDAVLMAECDGVWLAYKPVSHTRGGMLAVRKTWWSNVKWRVMCAWWEVTGK